MEIINCGEVVVMTQSMTVWNPDGRPLGILEVDRFFRTPTVIRGYSFHPFDADSKALQDGYDGISNETLLNAIATIEDNEGNWAKGRPQWISGGEGDWERIDPIVTPRINQTIFPYNGSARSFAIEVRFYNKVEGIN